MHRYKTVHANTGLPDKSCFLDYDSLNKPPQRAIKLLVGEQNLYNIVARYCGVVYPNGHRNHALVEYRHLEIGDFCLVEPDLQDEVVLVGERKEIHDLSASIIDGRTADQSTNMLNMLDRGSILWIIEGSPMAAGPHGVGSKALYSKISSLASKLQNDVAMVDNMHGTAVHLINLHLQASYCAEKKWQERKAQRTKTVFLNEVKNKKAHRIENKFMHMLMAVEGLREDGAASICSVYPSFPALKAAYEQCAAQGGDVDGLLMDITHHTQRSDRLGPAISRNVAEYFDVKQWGSSAKRKKPPVNEEIIIDDDDNSDDDNARNKRRKKNKEKRQ